MHTFGHSIFLQVILCGLIPVLGRKVGHQVLVFEILVNLFLDQSLILFLQIFNDLLIFRNISFRVRISEIILLFRNEFDAHLIDLVFLLESHLICSEIILDWWIEFSPGQYLVHARVKMSQILLLSVECILLTNIMHCQYLMLYLSFLYIRIARILRIPFLVLGTCEDVSDLTGIVVSLRKVFASLVRKTFADVCHLNFKNMFTNQIKKFEF